MNPALTKLRRLAKIRAIQHSSAQMHSAQAMREVRKLDALAQRLARLKLAIPPIADNAAGYALQQRCASAQRLDNAAADIAHSRLEADARLLVRQSQQQQAFAREWGVQQVTQAHEEAHRRSEELRTDSQHHHKLSPSRKVRKLGARS
jgi:hypothetical protein